jgi:ankyrin repeat protein
MATIIDWLDMTNFNRQNNVHQQYEKQLSSYLDGTCSWIFHKPEYLAWASDDSSGETSRVLWVCGPAGHGKTVLCAKIVEHFKTRHEFPVAFFFSSPHAASASAGDINFIIRSWMMQIAAVDPTILELIRGYSERSGIGNRALESEVWSAFEAVLVQKQGVALFLDGLDEYPQTDDARIGFLRKLKSVAAGTATRILITSREEIDIKAELSPESTQVLEQVILRCRIRREDVDGDLKLYSRSVVDKKLPKKDESLRMKLASQLAERCEGMFLWIHLQQPQLRDTKSKTTLERIVENMPLGLIETYRKKWEAIKRQPADDQDRAFAILRWTTFALRPLSISEISEALVVNTYAKCSGLPIDELPDDIDEEYIDNEIIAICGSLVEVRRANTEAKSGSKTIHVVHPSVREFLLSVLPKHLEMLSDKASTVEHAASSADQHRYLSSVCLTYLNYDNVWNNPESNQSCISGHPFLDYAARFWHMHLENAMIEDPWRSRMVSDFFHTGTTTFSQWAKYFESCQKTEDSEEKAAGTPMYYAALFDLHMIMESIWNEDKTQLNVLGGGYGTPLQAACAKHKNKAFEMLMRWGADVNVEGGEFGVALVAAAAGGFRDMVTVLVNNRAELELKDSMGRAALYTAARNGFKDVVDYLLTAGAEIATTNKYDNTLVNSAADNGHLEVVRLLLDRGADATITIPSSNGWMPVNSAANNGHLEVVRLLLDRGANATTPNSDGWTPINSAATNGHLEVVRLLLDRGANATTPNSDGWMPVNSAANNGHLEVVRLLLDRGADATITIPSSDGWMPINSAATNGHLEVVRLLLDRGADATITIPSSNGWIPVNSAANNGHLEVVRLLLDRGANATTLNSDGWMPVNSAANNGHLEVVRLLLDRGANTTTPNSYGWTPINLAANNGHLEVVRLLLDRGANTTTPNSYGWTPINSAADSGHLEVVRLLLDRGADAMTPNSYGRTPINLAANNGHLEVVRLLLDRGADATIPDKCRQTPFHSAALSGNIQIVNLLFDFVHRPLIPLETVEHGQSSRSLVSQLIPPINSSPQRIFGINATCDLYGTAVHAAAYKGHLTMLQALVEIHKADITVRDQMGRSPLHLAARSGDIRCVNYLLDQGLRCSDQDFFGNSTIYYACSSGSLEVTHRVLELDPIKIPDSNKWSPLHWACRTGDQGLVELLIKNGGHETLVCTAQPPAAWKPISVALFHRNPNFESVTEAALLEMFRTPLASSPVLQSTSTSTSAIDTKGVRHGSFFCDGCFHVSLVSNQEALLILNQDIYGPRFHCTVCHDFDFCLMCNHTAERLHLGHDLQMIKPE